MVEVERNELASWDLEQLKSVDTAGELLAQLQQVVDVE